jgi:predicted nuclease of predicted toxin-antitoxin system
MKILLDECVPWPLRDLLPDHDCMNLQGQGWTGMPNGELLRLAAQQFDLFVTADPSILSQQNPTDTPIAILELSTNDIRRIRASAPAIALAAARIQPREYLKLMVN